MTIILKIFLPTFWLVFFGAFVVVLWIYKIDAFRGLSPNNFRILATVLYLIFVLLFVFSLMRLKRVEMDSESIFVTNYFKHVKYPWSNVEKINESPFPFVRVATVILKTPGRFGKKLFFIPHKRRFNEFLSENPKVTKALLEREAG